MVPNLAVFSGRQMQEKGYLEDEDAGEGENPAEVE